MAEYDKRSKKECLAVLEDPSSTPEAISSAQKRIQEINEWAKNKDKKPEARSAPEIPRVDYGKIPDGLGEEAAKLTAAWSAYASIAATIVDGVQPNLDARTRGAAVSAVVDQLIQMRKVEALKEIAKVKA